MEKTECPSCAVEIDTGEEVCPICGYEFPRQPARSFKIAVWILVLLMLVWLLL